MPKVNPLIIRHYKGNPKIKAAGVKMRFTKEQIEERIKCSQDPIYFIEKYVKIIHIDRGIISFKLRDFQKEFIDLVEENNYIIAKLPRQVGKSITIISYILWYVLFNPTKSVAILANKSSTSREILGKLQLAYENIPFWMQQGVVTWNKGNIELENNSRVIASSTSSDSARSYTYNLIMLDEFAFVPRNVADKFITSVYPTISSGKTAKVIMVSTPNGMNLFYKYWVDAVEGRNKYKPIEAHWSVVPERDQKWYEETIANMGEEKFAQEFGCEFLGSIRTLISPIKLKEMPWITPIFEKHNIKMYEKPEDNRIYMVCVDTSEGKGLDNSAFSVIDITEMPYKQVCVYKSNDVDPILYPTIIANVAMKYNEAFILVETNDIGSQVATMLQEDLEYTNLLYTVSRGRNGQQLTAGFKPSSKIGVTMSKPVKAKGCANLKSMIESDQLIIQNFDTIEELSNFVQVGKSYQAEEGLSDDIAMTLVLFGWVSVQGYFKELCDQDIRQMLQNKKMQASESELLPLGSTTNNNGKEIIIGNDGTVWESANENHDSENGFVYPIGSQHIQKKSGHNNL